MHGWDRVTLGHVRDSSGGVIRTGPFGSQLHQADYTDDPGGTPVVMPKDIVDGRIVDVSIARIDAETLDRLAVHRLRLGDIVMARRGDIGRRALVDSRSAGWLCGTGSLRISLPGSELDSAYLYYVLGTEEAVGWLRGQAVGATMANLNTDIVARMAVSCPPTAVQKKIAAVLTAYDELIENNLRRIEILEKMAQAIYREWFVNFRHPGHEADDLVDSPLGPIPDGWAVSDLRRSARWLSGGTPKTGEPSFWGGPIPWITSGSLTTFLLDRSDRTLTEDGVAAGSRLVPRDTLVFVVRGMSLAKEFRHGIAEVPLAFGQDCKALIAQPPVHSLYLAYSVASRASEIQGMVEFAAHGTGKLSTDRLQALPVLHPPEHLQVAFDGAVGPIRQLMSNLRQQIDNLHTTRDVLLPRLVSGEIDVSELDIDTSWLVA